MFQLPQLVLQSVPQVASRTREPDSWLSLRPQAPDSLDAHAAYPDVRITRAVQLVPSAWLLFYFVALHFWIFGVPKSIKARLQPILQDSVTLEDLDTEPVQRRPIKWKAIAFVLLSGARLGLEVAFLVSTVRSYGSEQRWRLIQHALGVASWTITTIYLVAKPCITPICGLLAFFIFDILNAVYSLILKVNPGLQAIYAAQQGTLAILLLALMSTLPLTSVIISDKVASPYDAPSDTIDSPEDGTSLLSWMLVTWMNPLLWLARRQELNEPDIWKLSPFFKHHIIFPVFKGMPGSTLLRKITYFTAYDLVITSLCSLCIAFLSFSFPYFLKKILEALSSSSFELRAKAYHLALLGFLCSLLQMSLELVRQWHSRRSYERVRGALITMVFEKATRKKDTSGSLGHRQMDENEADVQGAESGRIMNLMNGDCYSVAQWFWEVSVIIRAPIELLAGVFFLYQILGWSSLVGLATVILPIVVLRSLSIRNMALQRALLASTDRRIAVISELVGAIRFLKYYAWEKIWVDKAIDAREKELSNRYRMNFNMAFVTSTVTLAPTLMNVVTFACYTKIAKQELTIPVAFAGIAVFQMVQTNIGSLPPRIFFYLNTLISVRRLHRFLDEAEIPSDDTGEAPESRSNGPSVQRATGIGFEDATFEYPKHEIREEDASTFTLSCPTFEIPAGQVTLVCGDNASGKSSLLMAILGEMDLVQGRMDRPHTANSYALATQDSWLEQATVKENILFGAPYNEKRLEEVLDACALKPDLARWTAGVDTEIGERGVSLSGGQRARVALARAVYSPAKILLLDDPLSAVDAHTARHLVENCLRGPLMQDRTVILVTHHVQLCLPAASLVIRMVSGKAQPETIDRTASGTSSRNDSVKEDDEETRVDSDEDTKATPLPAATPVDATIITKENRETGSVKWTVYRLYLRAAGIETWIGILSMLLAVRLFTVVQQFYLKWWGESYTRRQQSTTSLLPPASENVNPWLWIYFGLGFVYATLILLRLAFSYHGSFKAARKLLYDCLIRVTHAPSRWLDQNPTGRIVNRFTADVSSIDNTVTNSVTDVVSDVMGFVASLGAVLFIVPRFIAFAAAAMALYVFLATPYVRASRDLRRLENNHRSPLFSRFGGLLRGLKVIRAYGQQGRYLKHLTDELDVFQAFDHFFWTARFYLSLRFDFVGALAILAVQLFALNGGVSQGSAAFAIVLSQQFVSALHQTVWSYAKLELDINSIERIFDLLNTPQEPPMDIEKTKPSAHWPAKGEIYIDNLSVKYAPHLPFALNGVNLKIQQGEKVGIVGRTGSGKTTLALSLLRITEPAAGSITIDGVDIAKIGLRDLRERVTIISQESTLFEGTVRSNLDPQGQYSDSEIFDVLRRVGMARSPESRAEDAARLVTNLEMQVTTGGENFSQGERQLLSIARALLRRTNVFVADEATASVDFATDEQVQHTLRKELSGCTVITIAHRLRTVIDVDRIILLEDGILKEIGRPRELLADSSSAFYELCRQSNELEQLKQLAGQDP